MWHPKTCGEAPQLGVWLLFCWHETLHAVCDWGLRAPILGVHCSCPGRWFPLVLSFAALGYFLTEEWASIEMRLQHDIGIFVGVGLVTILVYINIYFWLRRKQVRAAISQENQENEAELDPVEEASRESFSVSDFGASVTTTVRRLR